MTTALPTLAGIVLVVLALRDIFHTLWHPRGFGRLAQWVFRGVWRVSRWWNRSGKHSTELAGPVGLLTTVLSWTALIVVGMALIYWPRMPSAFFYGAALDPSRSADFLSALYLSLVALATLGFGDIVPSDEVMRILLPLEALVGFVLFTAAISWILQVYPVLSRRRRLARHLNILARTDSLRVVRTGDIRVATALINSVTDGVISAEVDFKQYGETYYFREREPHESLAANIGFLEDLQGAGMSVEAAEVRHASHALQRAIEALAHTIPAGNMRAEGSVTATFEAFALDHQQPPPEAPTKTGPF